MDHAIGLRLFAARRATGLSTRRVEFELAKRGCTVTHATIANYEKGQTKPNMHVLVHLSEVYGRTLNSFLLPADTIVGVQYRSLKSVRIKEKQQFEANAQRWLEAYRQIERHLNNPLENELSDFKIDPQETPDKTASALRKKIGLADDEPIPSVIGVLEAFGIRVISLETEARIDALAGLLGVEKVVVLNSVLTNDRIRLSASHELGHHCYSDCIPARRPTTKALEERAFDFGSHLLLPDSQLRAAFKNKSIYDLIGFKERFGLSLASMIYRGRQLGLLTDRTYQRLWIEFSKYGWRTNEPGYVQSDHPKRFERLVDSAVRQGKLTMQQCAEIAGVREADLHARLLRATAN